jgi:hypothetical protein
MRECKKEHLTEEHIIAETKSGGSSNILNRLNVMNRLRSEETKMTQ